MKRVQSWLGRVNFRIPAPLAAALLLLVGVGAILAVCIDWSTARLPAQGAPGRHDWATEKYYKQWRLRQDAEEDRWFKQHPEYAKYRGLPPNEIRLRIQAERNRP
jgi:hypothetical protein